jgi:hypothetical protein
VIVFGAVVEADRGGDAMLPQGPVQGRD